MNYRQIIADQCTDCGVCVQSCFFLQRFGTPGFIARQGIDGHPELTYGCTLCGLCKQRCPVHLAPDEMFLAFRQHNAETGRSPHPRHLPLLRYEAAGYSRWLTGYILPKGGRQIFFPGCAFTGTRSSTLLNVFDRLLSIHPDTGIVLDCCGTPSHALGMANQQHARFLESVRFLVEHGIETIYTACPNCYIMFKKYGRNLKPVMAASILNEHLHQPDVSVSESPAFTIHDPCVLRHESGVQDDVRQLATRLGIRIYDTKHSGENAICCGAGAGLAFFDNTLAAQWRDLRLEEARSAETVTGNPMPVLTYCAGCQERLGENSIHILDILANPQRALNGNPRVIKSPFTYPARLMTKHRLIRRFKGYATIAERRGKHRELTAIS